jgi:hypothetical protein
MSSFHVPGIGMCAPVEETVARVRDPAAAFDRMRILAYLTFHAIDDLAPDDRFQHPRQEIGRMIAMRRMMETSFAAARGRREWAERRAAETDVPGWSTPAVPEVEALGVLVDDSSEGAGAKGAGSGKEAA